MSVIEDKWKEEQCRDEYGIFFSNDECILLEGEVTTGFVGSARISVASLIENKEDYWTHLYAVPSCHTEKNGFVVVGGETSWEGDGFIALIEAVSNNLIWVIHLEQSEGFREVCIENEYILATSAEYYGYRWKIPLKNPEKLQMLEAF